ncbi:helix-turn-helix transcriptional regulator [Paenibacillus sp. R14(2021)]|uniref:helix-turn-helix domain-containing protein n=1 Tax=Paenibacillus sp. R14(2021) TaxID=2859228 RepID=UPI001C614674|nr:helix-turn-helix transcriptional regulator [Paenibacillus sp. R14(2021)]
MVDIFAYSSDAVMIIRKNPDNWTVYACSSAFYSLIDSSCEQLIGKDLSELPLIGIYPLWPIIRRMCSDISPGTPEVYAESYFSLTGDTQLFGELYAKKLQESGEPLIMITIRDRSEHHWIDDRVSESTPIVSLLLTNSFTIASLRSYRGPIMYDMLELTRAESGQFLAEQDRERVRSQLLDIQASGNTSELYFTQQLDEKQYLTSIVVKPFYHANGSFKCYAIVVYSMVPVQDEEVSLAAPVNELIQRDASYKLRLLMMEKQISVTKLAENTQISLTTISNIRNGKIKKPQRLTAKLIADELGVAPSDIWDAFQS